MSNDELIGQLQHQIGLARETLGAAGSLCVESGHLEASSRRLWVHSEFGPAVQDKDSNQDFVIAWQDHGETEETKGHWAIVMADGVTSSCWAEWGAELACWISLAKLVELRGVRAGKQLALNSVNAAGEAIGKLADVITKGPQQYRPKDEFEATWEYVLSEGLFLQTTLTLVWWDGYLHIAIVGDGAVTIRESNDAGCRTIAGSDLQSSWVQAIGPNNRQLAELGAWDRLELKMPCSMAVFTDGVARGVSCDVGEIFAHADAAIVGGKTNPAQRVLGLLQQNRPKDFEDNLSLGLVYIDR